MKSSFPLLVLGAGAVLQCAAKPQFVKRIPNGDKVDGVAALGHVDPDGGGERNAFGLAFDDAGFAWTKELCQMDSDGDGQTNGQELGDPCCEWVEGSNEKVSWSSGVSAPGDANSKSDPSLWESVKCSTGSGQASGGGNDTMTTPGQIPSPSPTPDTATSLLPVSTIVVVSLTSVLALLW